MAKPKRSKAAQLPLTPAQRSLRSSVASHTRWASVADRTAATAAAHSASKVSRTYWERQVAEAAETAGETPPPNGPELAKRAENAHRAYMRGLSLKSSRVRQARAAGHRNP